MAAITSANSWAAICWGALAPVMATTLSEVAVPLKLSDRAPQVWAVGPVLFAAVDAVWHNQMTIPPFTLRWPKWIWDCVASA